ncbi:hypothetical protein PCANC_27570 [Puccinia coronata f. sp. avenae]|uniref:Uncharacterized protein n=1 Tax=Puccinia coronata f. sp. avenae TaxID=200324 RepID=A0A2N5TIV0_9BASI|nr:hypothetical protein PCANC_27570 [Puccinia coronata f. sp. avenae]
MLLLSGWLCHSSKLTNVKKGNTTASSVTLPGPSSDNPVVVNNNQSQQATPGAVGEFTQPKGLTAAGDNTMGSNDDSSGDHSSFHNGREDKSPPPQFCIMLTPTEESQAILNRSPARKGQGRAFRFTNKQSTQLLGGIIQALSLSVCRPH